MKKKRTFCKVLADNRSEIAIRIFRAANELGMRTVAIFSLEDRVWPWYSGLPVLAASYFQEPTWDTLFAVRIPADYCLHTPGQNSAWGVLVSWEVRCGVIRSRMRRKPRSRKQKICQ
jgi:hypothetical protein